MRLLNKRGDNRKPGITWGQLLGNDDCPYMKRWVVNFGAGSLRLHHWYASDDDRGIHDHPWPFVTLVLKGGYTDVSDPDPSREWAIPPVNCGTCRGREGVVCDFCGNGFRNLRDHLGAGSVRHRPARHAHTVQVDPGGCWTLVLTSKHMRDWGFFMPEGWMRQRAFFRKYGHHPCD